MCCEVQLFSHDQKTYVEMYEDDSRGERLTRPDAAVYARRVGELLLPVSSHHSTQPFLIQKWA